MSNFEINSDRNSTNITQVNSAKQKQLAKKTQISKSEFKLEYDDFAKNLFESPQKTAKALTTIDSIGGKLNKIANFINDVKNGHNSVNLEEESREEFIKAFDEVKELKDTNEFKVIYSKLSKSGLTLNIGSQKVDNLVNHFFDTKLGESEPILSGIFDHSSSLNRLNTNDFTLIDDYVVTELNSIDDDEALLEGVALINKETSQVEKTLNLISLPENFKKFPSRSFSSDNNKILISLNGLKNNETSDSELSAAFLFNIESEESPISFNHEDFNTNASFKGAEIKGENVYIHSEGAEYVFNTDGNFISKAKASKGKLNESKILGDKLYAIAASSKTDNGRVVGALYQFDIETGKQTAEIPKPGSYGNGTFGVNMESLDDKLFIAESEIVKKDDDHYTKGRVHVFNSKTGEFEGEINPKNDVKGLGLFGESMAVSSTFMAVTTKTISATGTENTSIHVFDSRKGNQIHKITPQFYGTELNGNIEINEDKLLMSAKDKSGRSNIYEFDLSTREKNLEKFMSMIGDDARVFDAIKTNIVANRLAAMQSESVYTGREGKESVYTGREVSSIKEKLENSDELVSSKRDSDALSVGKEKVNYTGDFLKKKDEASIIENTDEELSTDKNIVFADRKIYSDHNKVVDPRVQESDSTKSLKVDFNIHKSRNESKIIDIEDNSNQEIDKKTNINNAESKSKNLRTEDLDQKYDSQIEKENSIIDNFVSNIEIQANIAANQTSSMLKNSIPKANNGKDFKAQANASKVKAMDILP